MTTIVLADDHHVVRQGLRALLESEPEISIVGEAADGLEAADLVTPDGVPLVWGLRLLGVPDASRVYGPDLTLWVCEEAARRDASEGPPAILRSEG